MLFTIILFIATFRWIKDEYITNKAHSYDIFLISVVLPPSPRSYSQIQDLPLLLFVQCREQNRYRISFAEQFERSNRKFKKTFFLFYSKTKYDLSLRNNYGFHRLYARELCHFLFATENVKPMFCISGLWIFVYSVAYIGLPVLLCCCEITRERRDLNSIRNICCRFVLWTYFTTIYTTNPQEIRNR